MCPMIPACPADGSAHNNQSWRLKRSSATGAAAHRADTSRISSEGCVPGTLRPNSARSTAIHAVCTGFQTVWSRRRQRQVFRFAAAVGIRGCSVCRLAPARFKSRACCALLLAARIGRALLHRFFRREHGVTNGDMLMRQERALLHRFFRREHGVTNDDMLMRIERASTSSLLLRPRRRRRSRRPSGYCPCR